MAQPDDSISIDSGTSAMVETSDMSRAIPGDTYYPWQWQLTGTWGLHADRVWADYTGAGTVVGVLDDGFDTAHPDIAANYRAGLDRDIVNNDDDATTDLSADNHGTAVMGTIIGDDNGIGTVGVAFDATAYGIRVSFGAGGSFSDLVEAFQYADSTGLDVMNNSWGFTTPFADTVNIDFSGLDFTNLEAIMAGMTAHGRGGLGSNIVFAAGNARTGGDDVNYHYMSSSPYTIAVAAIDQSGNYSYFSTPGAALLVAAAGTSVYTTDRTGADGYSGSDYTNFSGTSASTPVVSGMIAVMLEANANLGWRDVQNILAYSAQHNDPGSAGWQYNGANNWNGGGLHFSHDYGFGAADLFTAVRLAESWNTTPATAGNMAVTTAVYATPSLAIADNGIVTDSITVSENIRIERVIVDLDISHAKAGDLVVTLISPDGTESVLANRPVNGAFTTSYGYAGIDFEMSSNADRGENSQGTWTLRVEDKVTGDTGVLNGWSLRFIGSTVTADDIYFYTNDYGDFSGSARDQLQDANNGTDMINLAAVTANTILDMRAGTSSTVAGRNLSIAAGSVIENAWLGDGNDRITGNSVNNNIHTGRGNDTIIGSLGDDQIDGGAGTDVLQYAAAFAEFSFSLISGTVVHITHTLNDLWTDIVTNVESFVFSDGSYAFAALGNPGNNNNNNFSSLPAVQGQAKSDSMLGGASAEAMYGQGGNDKMYGAGGNDALYGDIGNDKIFGGSGDDYVDGGVGNDKMYGDIGDDRMYGGGENDTLMGDTGNDYLAGDAGNDKIYGGDGNDTIYGGANDDKIYGDAGNDLLYAGSGANRVYGGEGSDTAVFDGNSSAFSLLRTSGSYLTVNGGGGSSRIYGDIEFIEFDDVTIDLSAVTLVKGGAAWSSLSMSNSIVSSDVLDAGDSLAASLVMDVPAATAQAAAPLSAAISAGNVDLGLVIQTEI